jgi:hypothetical protein
MFGVAIAATSSAKRLSRSGAILIGGMTNAGQSNTAQKFYFSPEVAAAMTPNISVPMIYSGWGATNPGSAGYALAGYGYDGNNSYSVQNDTKVNYATNTFSSLGSLVGNLSKSNPAQGSNAGVAGYAYGGYDATSAASTTAGKKISFATETVSNPGGSLSLARFGYFEMTNNGVCLYAAGGTNGTGPTSWYCTVNTVDKIDFATETRSNLYMPDARTEDQSGMSFSNSGVKGYVTGGFKGDCVNGANGVSGSYILSFTTNTFSNVASPSLWGADYGNAVSLKSVAGYFLGGRSSASISKVSFSTDTLSGLGSMLNAVGWAPKLVDSQGN